MSSYAENIGDPGEPLSLKPEGARTLGIYPTENRARRQLVQWGPDRASRASLRVCETERGWEVVRLTERCVERA